MLDILFVDDEPTIRLAVGDALRAAGHDVTLASDGAEALAETRTHLFDAVVTDVRMPNMTGIELFRRLRMEAPATDVILMTANAEVSDAVDALKNGASDYLIKPFDTAELIARLAQVAKKRELWTELSRARRALSERVGPYVLEEKIGEGAMGMVYRASHVMLRRPTAVKILLNSASSIAIARFEREVQLTCRLTHPNTIAIFDYGRTHDGVFYYAMELLDGASLDRIVETTGPMAEPRVVHFLRQLAGSLGEAHALGLIHRDVKPSNIQICERGGMYDVPKLLDFGLVKEVESPEMTQQNVILGTPAYLAPEVILDAAASGPAQDIYALGAVAYFMLAGKPAFAGKKAMEICLQQLNAVPASFRKHGVKVSKKLEDTIRACLEKNPRHRPKSAADVCAALPEREWSQREAGAWWKRYRKVVAGGRAGGTAVLSLSASASEKPKRKRQPSNMSV
jgi:CheY-like chemotaxis protein